MFWSLSPASVRVAQVAAVTLTSWAVLWPSGPAGAAQAGPGGTAATCTIVGTAKADKLVGTAGNDVICGLGGNDTITGNGGDDTIDGGAGDDVLSGGTGNDTLSGAAGRDTLTGGAGADSLSGGAGRDTVSYTDHSSAVTADLDGVRDDGAAGEKDQIGISVENLTGGSAGDTLTGSAGANVIAGGAGDDVIDAGPGNDRVTGGAGDDKIRGGGGADALDGNAGTNVCDKDPADAVLRCPPDAAAPVLHTYALDKNRVDVTAAAQPVVATARVTDDFAGVSTVTVSLAGPEEYAAPAVKTAGTALDGTWGATIQVPQDAPAGSYELRVAAEDVNGNALEPTGTTLVVEVSGDDETAPVLREWHAEPVGIDTVDEAADVAVTARVTDEVGVSTVTMKLVGPATYSEAAARTGGTAADGTYSAVVVVPQGAPAGEYALVVEATDDAGNTLAETTDTVVTNEAGVGEPEDPAPTDMTAPVLREWQAGPTTVDTSAGAEDVDVTARLTDTGSGVATVTMRLVGPGGIVYSTTATRTSGTAADGVYAGAVTMPEEAPAGSYTLFVGATDAAGNVLEPKETNVVVVNEKG